jgi:L-gulonolactone oxidase
LVLFDKIDFDLNNNILQVNVEKRYVIAQPGITLRDLHTELAKSNLAMMNVGSISDQTLAGIVTTATHGTGIAYGVMSTHVMALHLLLADGSHISCSRQEHSDIFSASLCGLGATGLILSIQLEVEPAFRLEELQESLPFEVVMQNLDKLVHSAQYVRFWWFPAADVVRCSYFDRTQEVSSSLNHDVQVLSPPRSLYFPSKIGGITHFWDTTSTS